MGVDVTDPTKAHHDNEKLTACKDEAAEAPKELTMALRWMLTRAAAFKALFPLIQLRRRWLNIAEPRRESLIDSVQLTLCSAELVLTCIAKSQDDIHQAGSQASFANCGINYICTRLRCCAERCPDRYDC